MLPLSRNFANLMSFDCNNRLERSIMLWNLCFKYEIKSTSMKVYWWSNGDTSLNGLIPQDRMNLNILRDVNIECILCVYPWCVFGISSMTWVHVIWSTRLFMDVDCATPPLLDSNVSFVSIFSIISWLFAYNLLMNSTKSSIICFHV